MQRTPPSGLDIWFDLAERGKGLKLRDRVESGIREIRDDRDHGARELALQALDVLVDAAESSDASESTDLADEVDRVISELESVRPSMAPIANTVRRIRADIENIQDSTSDTVRFREGLVDRIQEEKRSIRRSTEKIVGEMKSLLRGKKVMTHSYSSTVLEALLEARDEVAGVIVTESRPLFEGRSLARRLTEAGISVTIITDASAGHFLSDVDLVVVGADSILSDGSVVNKMGTFLIASAARERDVPFYVVSDSYKWSESVELQEGSSDEVLPDAPSGLEVRNIYFDVTPPHLVSSVVAELGIVSPEEFVSKMRERLGRE